MAYATTSHVEAGLFGRIANAFHAFIAKNAQHRAYRKTVLELQSLSSHELDDLGLNRGDILTIARESTFGK